MEDSLTVIVVANAAAATVLQPRDGQLTKRAKGVKEFSK